jgi:hypothetical protein
MDSQVRVHVVFLDNSPTGVAGEFDATALSALCVSDDVKTVSENGMMKLNSAK